MTEELVQLSVKTGSPEVLNELCYICWADINFPFQIFSESMRSRGLLTKFKMCRIMSFLYLFVVYNTAAIVDISMNTTFFSNFIHRMARCGQIFGVIKNNLENVLVCETVDALKINSFVF